MHMQIAKVLIRLRACAVWLGPSLSAYRILQNKPEEVKGWNMSVRMRRVNCIYLYCIYSRRHLFACRGQIFLWFRRSKTTLYVCKMLSVRSACACTQSSPNHTNFVFTKCGLTLQSLRSRLYARQASGFAIKFRTNQILFSATLGFINKIIRYI